jgi:large subunit ribosomal protein L4
MLESLRGENRKSMVVLPEHDANVYLSGRNISSNKTVVLSDLNTYDITNASVIILTESAAKMFGEEPAAVA